MLLRSLKLAVLLTFSSVALVSNTFACIDEHGLFPNAKNISIPTSYHNFLNPLSVTEEAFYSVTADVEKIYSPVIKSLGGVLKVVKDWKSKTANASAKRIGTVYQVNMYGGLARHPLITTDGYALVLCHEIGHHLGGKPLSSSWASNEGQADYFATSKCLRKYFSQQDNAAIVANMLVPDKVQTHCFKSFGPSTDHAICVRGALAGLAMANVFEALAKGGGARSWGKSSTPSNQTKPDFTTPDTSVVTSTFDRHPKAQCRLDTYFAGAVCEVSSSVDFSYNDEVSGACTNGVSARPACWYAAAQ
jgi:hypothetical protein